MSHKYDIDSDQLKCNFCTQWFKTTLHYANIQRYSLKACHKCLNSFNYTILHPESYQMFKVFLLDINLTISPPLLGTADQIHHLLLQLNLAKDEVKNRIAKQYQLKIRNLMKQMEKLTHKVEQAAKSLQINYLNKARLIQSQKGVKIKNQIIQKIDQFKNQTLQQFEESDLKLKKNASSRILAQIRNHSRYTNKQNQPINKAACKAIRDKINKPCLLQSSKDQKALSKSRQPHQLNPSLNKTLNKSVIFKSVKCLDQSRVWTPNSNYLQSQRAEIQRLIQNHHLKDTYLPCEVIKDNSNINKCQSKRTHAEAILDLKSHTSKGGDLIQLIGAQAQKINFQCFLQSLGSQSSAKVVRIIKSGIKDYDFDALLRFLSRHSSVQTLIVTNNRLSELSVQAFKNYLNKHPNNGLKRVYMGNNRILRQRVSGILKQALQKGVEICL